MQRWIEDGATWGQHWAFVSPRRPPLPEGDEPHPIDRFVRSKLRSLAVAPSLEASREELIRRLSFDLRGLPPSPEEVALFVGDRRAGAYERVVDRFLDSARYGERMAMSWLEAARYADTDGFQQDALRSNWPWRDWVVKAYNDNMPFDRFTIEQFAGDLLPEASTEQVLATCFHRNHMTNGEGGRDPEESRVDYVLDRVNTMGTLWLGLTLGCAQCHDHKYDPVSQAEYYGLSAFFNSIDETGQAGNRARPYLEYVPKTSSAGLAAANKWLAAREASYQAVRKRRSSDFEPWLEKLAEDIARAGGHESFVALRASELRSNQGASLEQDERAVIRVSGANTRHEDLIIEAEAGQQRATQHRDRASAQATMRITALRVTLLPFVTEAGLAGLSLARDGHALLTNVDVSVRRQGRRSLSKVALARASADHEFIQRGQTYGRVRDVLDDDPRNGWWTRGRPVIEARSALLTLAEPLHLGAKDVLVVALRQRSLRGFATPRRFVVEWCSELGPASRRLGYTPRERLARRGRAEALDRGERAALLDEFLAADERVQAASKRRDRARRRRNRYGRAARPQKVMVLRERKQPRPTHVLLAGVWNKKGQLVESSLPKVLVDRSVERHATRLDLARWLVSGTHPLTARVAVNRYWQAFFGEGLVRTPEDFGVQGQRPAYPSLLDWLAVEFVASGWDVKAMQRLIVTSATYKQSSRRRRDLDDPTNRLLARQSRFRLPSWMLRDSALAAGGLLQLRSGGPPVFPAQPDGVWADSTMGRLRYQPSVGDDLYRRSLYGFWRRLAAPPSMFDASKRRVCRVRVVRTNTPMHALTLLNEEGFVDASLALAMRVGARGTDQDRARDLYRRVLARDPDSTELRRLQAFVTRIRADYEGDAPAGRSLLQRARRVAESRGLEPVLSAALRMLSHSATPSAKQSAKRSTESSTKRSTKRSTKHSTETSTTRSTSKQSPARASAAPREVLDAFDDRVAARFASWVLAASLILNLDEALTRG